MKIGSRPIARIARTGELTPPGRSSRARRYSSAERASDSEAVTAASSVFALPGLELVGEVQQPDLLELGRRVERRALADARLPGDRVEDRVALLLRASMGHREDRIRPVLVGRALVAVRDPAHAGHLFANLGDVFLGHAPHAHAIRGEAGAAVEEDRREI